MTFLISVAFERRRENLSLSATLRSTIMALFLHIQSVRLKCLSVDSMCTSCMCEASFQSRFYWYIVKLIEIKLDLTIWRVVYSFPTFSISDFHIVIHFWQVSRFRVTFSPESACSLVRILAQMLWDSGTVA